MPSGAIFTRTASFPPRVGGNVATGDAVAAGVVLVRTASFIGGIAAGNAVGAGAVLPIAATVFRGTWGQAVGGVIQTGPSLIAGAAVGGAGADAGLLAVSSAVLVGAVSGEAGAIGATSAVTSTVEGGEAGGGAAADAGTLVVAHAILAGATAADSYYTGSELEVGTEVGGGAASVSVDAAGEVAEVAASIEAGEAFGSALFEPVGDPGRASSRSILAGEASGDALFEPLDTPGRGGSRTIEGGVASGTQQGQGFDYEFDLNFDGASAAGTEDGVAFGRVVVVQASIRPGVAEGQRRGFVGRWHPPIPVRSVEVEGALFRVRASLIPGRANATANVPGAHATTVAELIPGDATGQIVSLIAGRAIASATVEGAILERGVTVVSNLRILRRGEFLLVSEVDPVVCDNDLLMMRKAA